mmetsp:Transcript_68258/g.197770  ORF Transcript_68258/g.197770 Transcript_68258/m.197770 type:complete len:211 (-) Transcript_68258:526-1158(-)
METSSPPSSSSSSSSSSSHGGSSATRRSSYSAGSTVSASSPTSSASSARRTGEPRDVGNGNGVPLTAASWSDKLSTSCCNNCSSALGATSRMRSSNASKRSSWRRSTSSCGWSMRFAWGKTSRCPSMLRSLASNSASCLPDTALPLESAAKHLLWFSTSAMRIRNSSSPLAPSSEAAVRDNPVAGCPPMPATPESALRTRPCTVSASPST